MSALGYSLILDFWSKSQRKYRENYFVHCIFQINSLLFYLYWIDLIISMWYKHGAQFFCYSRLAAFLVVSTQLWCISFQIGAGSQVVNLSSILEYLQSSRFLKTKNLKLLVTGGVCIVMRWLTNWLTAWQPWSSDCLSQHDNLKTSSL